MLVLLAASIGVVAVPWFRNQDTPETPTRTECNPPWFYSRPSHISGIPENWTHRELLDHLKTRGVEYVMFLREPELRSGSDALFVVPTSPFAVDRQAAEKGFFVEHDPNVVYVQLRNSEDEGWHPVRNPDQEFWHSSAGRFVFVGSRDQLMRIRQALP